MASRKINAIILANEYPGDHLFWIKACDCFPSKISYRIVDLTSNNWLEEIQSSPSEILLAKPSGFTASFKQLCDERVYILSKVLNYPVFPSAEEIFIYENKRFLSYWLKASNIPHPCTSVFYNREEAEGFLENQVFPIVGKTNIGSSGSGVMILKTKREALVYLKQCFTGPGAPKRKGPNFSTGNLLNRGLHYLAHPKDISEKLALYKTISSDVQRSFVIFQKYIPHCYEWRVVRIGNSFFAHKKLKIGEKASGSLLKGYEAPPIQLLDFVKGITDRHEFYCLAVDVFESKDEYLVNEMQCMFGQSDPYQMLINGIPGRYRYLEGEWTFEEGDYNQNGSFNLRVEFILQKYLK
jgi:glutathione synthase/RimK-type ligase-like ATP-grasp enzyme